MAIKSRLLSKLKSACATMNMAVNNHPQEIHVVLRNLTEARSLCQQGLTESNYAKYGEIYDGLILSIAQISTGEAEKDAEEIVGLCRELLEHIVRETGREEHFKKEMVFLPYKASMWDSLESVWRAAHEDRDNCLAYVIPIPYCDRNPDGTAREWHYERDLFPRDVPTLDWQKVDLKYMHPDVIFFHYPYDNFNRVTSPSEEYYSRNLKECADKLVYIPYFVLEEPDLDYDDPEKEKEVLEYEAERAHYILEPGIFNADFTIVQSNPMKKLYVDVLTRNTNAPKDYWDKHILGLGSPKFDRVTNSKNEEYDLPKKWQKIIYGRKTILYNTGLTAMLKHTDRYLEKLRLVLETFKNQSDVVLWWRPHPLLRSTIESMQPKLLDEYDGIVNNYRKEGWGIYDETPDLDRSISNTDAYYGDWSSVVHLYEKTGKPIMIQYVEQELDDNPYVADGKKEKEQNQEKGKRWGFNIFDFIDYNGYYWFAAIDYNALFRMHKQTKLIEYLGAFPGEDYLAGRLYTTVNQWHGKLYFTPCTAHEIGGYDTEKMAFFKIDIGISPEENDISDIKYQKKYISSFIYLNTLVLIPCCYNKIIYCNLESEEIEGDEESCEYFRNMYCDKTTATDGFYYFCWFAFRISDSEVAFHLHNNRNKVIFFNLSSRKLREKSIGNKTNTYLCSAFDGESIWLYNLNGDSVVSWNRKDGKTMEICLEGKIDDLELHGLSYSFINMNILGDYLYLIPALSNMVIKVNKRSGEIAKCNILTIECEGEANIPFTHMCKVDKETLYLCGINKNEIIEYNMIGNKRKINLVVPNEYRKEIYEKLLCANMKNWGRVWWEPGISLSDYINFFDRKDYEGESNTANVGYNIFMNMIGN